MRRIKQRRAILHEATLKGTICRVWRSHQLNKLLQSELRRLLLVVLLCGGPEDGDELAQLQWCGREGGMAHIAVPELITQ